ncbi:MAG: sulfite exporter TauE/SafE family protein, partial [Spirochaetales bacterium]|nr:sulfite exporter TauE/SafE family protein [Spirochaetales bacterium]
RRYGNEEYVVNLWIAIPITAAAGLVAGAVGISGGSFKVPLMVLLCGVPMRIAVGTSSAMVAVTALMGFVGHAISGHFDPHWAIPVACAAVVGGMIGGKLAIKTNPQRLKVIFAFTTLAAAIVMAVNAFLSR